MRMPGLPWGPNISPSPAGGGFRFGGGGGGSGSHPGHWMPRAAMAAIEKRGGGPLLGDSSVLLFTIDCIEKVCEHSLPQQHYVCY